QQEVEDSLQSLKGEYKEIAWGSQIRTYTLNPFTLIKDHRTSLEVGNVQAVLDGDLDEFIYAYLHRK
ncbi:MAG: peptide chain release factor 2, partial [Syntrophomonadaceae bacterium]|nr:peptide chain release factor 2 [Syntrophomonadaceae bacterium]